MRKIIQVAPVSSRRSTGFDLFALCDDGTVWWRSRHGWEQAEDIPQPEAQEQPPASLTTWRQNRPEEVNPINVVPMQYPQWTGPTWKIWAPDPA